MRGQNNRQVGAEKEKLVCSWLEQHGYRIVEQNFRCRSGEIDIVAKEDRYLVFIEVKYRSNAANGWPEEAVDWHKQQVISRVALFYLKRFGYEETTPVRFDVVSVINDEGPTIRLYQNAFEFCQY